MVSKTFDEWTKAGFFVLKGEKATGRNKDGIATFTEDQVEDINDWICDPYNE